MIIVKVEGSNGIEKALKKYKSRFVKHRIMDEIKSLRDSIDQHNEKEEQDLQKLSQWKWMVAGGVIVFAWLVSNVKLEMLGKLFN